MYLSLIWGALATKRLFPEWSCEKIQLCTMQNFCYLQSADWKVSLENFEFLPHSGSVADANWPSILLFIVEKLFFTLVSLTSTKNHSIKWKFQLLFDFDHYHFCFILIYACILNTFRCFFCEILQKLKLNYKYRHSAKWMCQTPYRISFLAETYLKGTQKP